MLPVERDPDSRRVPLHSTAIDMMPIKWRRPALYGFGGGCVAGLALVALMYVANLVLGLRPLPQLLNEPLLSLMPGWMFGFLIDTLQHAGKVVEEAGLIVGMVIGLGVLGAATSVAALRWRSRYLPFAFAAPGWIVVVVALLPAGGAGPLAPHHRAPAAIPGPFPAPLS